MLALTVRQPWAHFLATGQKPVENRDWPAPAALLGKWIAIHAGKLYDLPGAIGIRDELGIDVPLPDELEHGAIIAVAVIDRVAKTDHDAGYNEWYCGPYGWFFRDVVKIAPVPCRGHNNLWPVPYKELALVRAAYRATDHYRAAQAAKTPENSAPKN